MRRAAHPSGCARCGAGAGCPALKYRSLPLLGPRSKRSWGWDLHWSLARGWSRDEEFANNYFTEMCSGSEACSYIRLIHFAYHSTLGLRVIKKRERGTEIQVEWLEAVPRRLTARGRRRRGRGSGRSKEVEIERTCLFWSHLNGNFNPIRGYGGLTYSFDLVAAGGGSAGAQSARFGSAPHQPQVAGAAASPHPPPPNRRWR